jgi:hypothetical protein
MTPSKLIPQIEYHPDHIRKLMRAQALERDETAINAWLETTQPELVKRGRQKTRRSSTRTRLVRA